MKLYRLSWILWLIGFATIAVSWLADFPGYIQWIGLGTGAIGIAMAFIRKDDQNALAEVPSSDSQTDQEPETEPAEETPADH